MATTLNYGTITIVESTFADYSSNKNFTRKKEKLCSSGNIDL